MLQNNFSNKTSTRVTKVLNCNLMLFVEINELTKKKKPSKKCNATENRFFEINS